MTKAKPVHQRILLKLSGEALMGEDAFGINRATIERIVARARVGNIYVNRNQIGAVVGVQPFGGQGLSGTGPKAGGPHYLLRFVTEKTVTINTTASGGNASLLTLGD